MSKRATIRASAAIDVVEAAYRLDGSETEWLASVLQCATADLDTGHGVYAFTGDESAPNFGATPAFVPLGLSPAFLARIAELNTGAPNAIFELLKSRLVTCGGLEQVLGASSEIVTHFRGVMASADIADGFCMFAQDTRGGSITISAPCRDVVAPSPRVRGIWHRVGLHVVAALRLRRRLQASTTPHDALLSPSGTVADASAPVADDRDARKVLASAVRAMEQARRAGVRGSPDEALALWQGLVAGRWSLVDHWEQGGRRYIAAYANRPGLRDPRALTGTEQSVLQYLALGTANKEIAYALGLSVKTVAVCVARILKKLGVQSRTQLTAVFDASRSQRFDLSTIDDSLAVVEIDGASHGATTAKLSKAEREIAESVARGWTNARIAEARGVAESTVAKQLQGIYTKLGVDNRRRLARVIAQGQS